MWLCPRQVRLVVELLWPLFLFLILVWVRTTSQPFHKGQCKYQRAGRRGGAAAPVASASLSPGRSLPQQGHAVGRSAAVAPGDDLQHGEPVSEPAHAGRDAGPSQQLQRLHVAAQTLLLTGQPRRRYLTVVRSPQTGRRADGAADAAEGALRPPGGAGAGGRL